MAPAAPAAALDEPFFADVPTSSTFFTYIEWMAARGVSTGTAQSTGRPLYKPSGSVSRQAMAAFLYRLSGAAFPPPADPTFADVDATSPFFTAIEWMAAEGISTGTVQPSGKPLYKHADPVSRQAMALFLARWFDADLPIPTEPTFADVPISSAPAAASAWMFRAGISTGTSQSEGLPLYKPADAVSRQAMAAFLYRLGQKAWSTERVTFELISGTVSSITTTVALPAIVDDLRIEVNGAAAEFITIDQDSIAVAPDGRWTVPIVAASDAADEGNFVGSLVLLDGEVELAEPLPLALAITQPDAFFVPASLAAPAESQLTTLAGSTITAGEIDIQLKPVADPEGSARRIAETFNASIIGSSPSLRLYQLRVPGLDPVALSALANQIGGDPEVMTALLALSMSTESDPVNDAEFAGQWDTPGGDTWPQKMIHVDEAWRLSTGAGVDVGVVDLGFVASHEDLRPNIRSITGPTRLPKHGTHVAGLACAAGNNGVGIAGIAYNCDLHLRAVDLGGSPMLMVAAMHEVTQSASIVNISIGPDSDHDCHAAVKTDEQAAFDGEVTKYRELMRGVIRAHPDVLWVAAAGNDSYNVDCGTFGALDAEDNVVSVAAVGPTGVIASYSNRGPGITVAAPGGDTDGEMLSALPTSCFGVFDWNTCKQTRYGPLMGTSMAAPIVTGVAALAKGANPSITTLQLRQCIVYGARDGNVLVDNEFYLVDARRTVECALRLGPAPSGTIGRTVPSPAAWGVAVDGTRDRLYVIDQTSRALRVYDSISGLALAVVPITGNPLAVTVDKVTNTAIVTSQVGGRVTLVDGETFATRSVTFDGNPLAVAVDESRGRIYVAASRSVVVIDEATTTVVLTMPASNAYAIAIDPSNDRVYIGDFGAQTLTVREGTTGDFVASVPVNYNALSMAINTVTHRLYVSGSDSQSGGVLDVIDTVSNVRLDTISTGGYRVAVDEHRDRIYTYMGPGMYSGITGQSEQFGVVRVIDGTTNQVIQTIRVGHYPIGIAVDDISGSIYVSDVTDGKVDIID